MIDEKLKAIFTSWKDHHWAVIFVFFATCLGILDSYLTDVLISKVGIEHEINPLVKLAYENNASFVWFIANVSIMAIYAMFITGFRLTIGFKYRANLIFSFLFAVRTSFVGYYFGALYVVDQYRFFMIWSFLLSIIVIYYVLKSGDSLSIANFESWIKYHSERFQFWLLTHNISLRKKISKPTGTVIKSGRPVNKLNKLAIIKYLSLLFCSLLFIPIGIQVVVQTIWPTYYKDPSRMFGAFTIYSASAFLASFVVIIIGVIGIMYSILRLAEQTYSSE